MNTFSEVPPGFRFHPTEELVAYYLRKKITSRTIDLDVIKDVDLYKIEPWDLQELCGIGAEDQNEWYFFSHKDKKYPSGTRTNRATAAGFWKATGRDKAIYSKHDLIGMRKTLVFYKGRAPNGLKSDWIMHEYRHETDENGTTPQDEGWVVCRAFKKRIPTTNKTNEREFPCWYDDRVRFINDLDSPISMQDTNNYNLPYACKEEFDPQHRVPNHHYLHQPPVLENPATSFGLHMQQQSRDHQHLHADVVYYGNSSNSGNDWRILEEEISKENYNYNSTASADTNLLIRRLNNREMVPENASTSTSDLWK